MKFTLSLVAALAAAFCFAGLGLAGSPGLRLNTGSTGPAVTRLQQFLHMNQRADYYGSTMDGVEGPYTKSGVLLWQKANHYRPTGWVVVGDSQWNLLKKQATVERLPQGIDSRAVAGSRQNGWSVDASKSTDMLYLLRYDASTHLVVIALSTPTSFGGCNSDGCFVTPDGAFPACRKAGPNEVSYEWKDAAGNPAPMPWAVYMLMDGSCSGAAVHYDPLGNSHECVHVPVMWEAQYINRHMPIGALIVVHG